MSERRQIEIGENLSHALRVVAVCAAVAAIWIWA